MHWWRTGNCTRARVHSVAAVTEFRVRWRGPDGQRARLHRGVCPRTRASPSSPHRESASRSACSAHPAAAARLPVPRQGEVPRFVRSRRQRSKGCVHGRLSGAVGRRCTLSGAVTEPDWRTKPSWYLVATEDTPAQRQMATRAGATAAEAAGSHAIYISKPEAVAALIAKAAKSVSSKMASQRSQG